ncbi:hypothetical protein AB6A40_006558 [Gnathostoma spinigerum]|uniref:Flavodoxin-like domain-containing protein n=1 Tax=Gnathostoma spinigerum TaxID=75299 RepID=A0ABD6ERE2_9BILA
MDCLLITYLSETGTAEDVAQTLWMEAKLRNVPCRVTSFEDYEVEKLATEKCAVFIVATSGQGEIPTGSRSNWKQLCRKSIPHDFLSVLKFAVLALGDSSYQKFNFAGKKVFRRLCQLGALPLFDIGLADDQHELGIDAVLIPFRERLFEVFAKERLFQNLQLEIDDKQLLPPRFMMTYEREVGNCRISTRAENAELQFERNSYEKVRVVENRRLTASDHFQDTRLLSLSPLEGQKRISYEPGDVLMLQPCNLSETVDLAVESLAYPSKLLDSPFTLIASDSNITLPPKWLVPSPTTLRYCLNRFFDLQGIPRRSFFKKLACISDDRMEKEKLEELSSTAGLVLLFL